MKGQLGGPPLARPERPTSAGTQGRLAGLEQGHGRGDECVSCTNRKGYRTVQPGFCFGSQQPSQRKMSSVL